MFVGWENFVRETAERNMDIYEPGNHWSRYVWMPGGDWESSQGNWFLVIGANITMYIDEHQGCSKCDLCEAQMVTVNKRRIKKTREEKNSTYEPW